MNHVGKNGSRVLFTDDKNGVVIDLEDNVVIESGSISSLTASASWESFDLDKNSSVYELAQAALTTLDISVVAAGSRLYTIPKAAQAEAKKALEWRKEYKRGGTPVGVNTARTLAKGGQIGIEKVRHIAKYFPRHEVDKKAKGYEPGEPGFPSRGRIAWALWGGDAAWRWAQQIVERENKKALKADGYALPGYDEDTYDFLKENNYDADLDSFATDGVEFIARMRMDGSGIDRLYKIEEDLSVSVWDGGYWHTLADVDADLVSYDLALDEFESNVEFSHVEIDPESALFLSACFQENPNDPVSLFDINHEEAELILKAADELDLEFLDRTILAVGAPTAKGDGVYTPEERSQKAQKQVRDKTGKFAKQGGRVVVAGDSTKRGNIVAINPQKSSVTVKLDSTGKTVEVPANLTEPENNAVPGVQSAPLPEVLGLDTTGILGQPRTPIDRPYVQLPGTLPRMTQQDIAKMQSDWPAFVKEQRDAFAKGSGTATQKSSIVTGPGQVPEFEKPDFLVELEKLTGVKLITDPYKHPALSDFLNKKVKGSDGKYYYPNKLYYQPAVSRVVAAAEAGKSVELTPETSDVQPIFFAIVSADDPSAVLELVSLVPASSTTTDAMTYIRKDKQWIRNEAILVDMNSPTPPPVVPLDATSLKSVIEQVDGITSVAASVMPDEDFITVLWGKGGNVMFLTAAGGPDRNRGNAERLRRYWTRGKGALKIRWGQPGDWSRCVRHLAKYLGPRAKGYCQLRHKEALGFYTATHAKRDRGRNNSVEELMMETPFDPLIMKPFTEVTPDDMDMELDYILGLEDDLFDSEWEPDEDIIVILNESSSDPLLAAGIVVAEEQELADALIEITQKYGKFNEDDSGVWAGYESAEENENKEIGVNCANCMLYAGGDVCKIIEQPVEPMGYCRFALIPDGVVKPVQAAGGLDRNRGNAERLRRYWTIGKGGIVKIRWNTPGDWTRCYRNLKKYMGPRAKGYCSLRHKEMTGMWPGDKRNPGMRKGALAIDDILTSEQIIDTSVLSAKANEARNRVLTAGAEIEYADGGKFSIPLVIPEEIESGDGRRFEKGAIEIRELPLPLMWQIQTAEGHNGSVVVGRIDHMERVENGIGNATGVFDQGEYGQEAERLVRNGFIRGVSADLDQFQANQETDLTDSKQEDSGKIGTDKLVITHARVMAVTLVPKPAFQECQIYLVDDEKQEDTVIPDGIYVDEMDAVEASALVACGVVAGAIPVVPPRSWFEDPKLNKATPLTVDDEGRVFGHIAAWHVDHIGMSFGTKPPRSRSKYAYFHTGVVRTDDGKDVPVGQLTLAGGHASLEASASEAVRHYDDTASAIADVHAGEDTHGIWVAGALRPGTTPEQIRALRASAPSGDWRPVKGQLELVAVCQVNVPGFPIARARVASGAVMALVAAGAGVLARMKSDPVAELSARVQKLEQLENAELSMKAEAAREKFNVVREQKAAQLSAMADAAYARIHGESKYDDEFGYISREKRQALAKKGYALPDGSYPITNIDSLKDSIQAYGRSKPGKRAAVRRHIMKRARALDRADLIPDKWKKASASLIEEDIQLLRDRAADFSIQVDEFADISKEARMKLAEKGQALPDGSYPIRNESDLKNAIKAYGRSNPEDRAKVRTHIRKRARALGKEDLIPDVWKAASTEEDLGKALAVEAQDQGKYTPETQPRDAKGKFRQVLARIKQDLGDSGSEEAIKKIEEVENLDDAGNYMDAARAAGDLISIVDRLYTGALDSQSLENVRSSARELGKVIANLPLPFGSDTEKVRYSDLPPALKGLIEDMILRVEDKIGQKDADEATVDLRSFMSGGDYYSQAEISSQMSKLLRLLT